MKVLHVIPSISTKRGGPSKAILEMVEALREQGIDAEILSTDDHTTYIEDKWKVGRWVTYRNIPILLLPCIKTRIRFIQEFLISPQLTFWLLRNIRKYDIIHVHAIFSYPSTITMLVARLNHKPYIVRTIGQLSPWSLNQSRCKKMLMLGLVESSNLKEASRIHVTSEKEMQDIFNLNMENKVICLGLGVRIPKTEIRHSKSPNNYTTYLYLSRLHPKKQLNILLKAFSILRFDLLIDNWNLIIAGDGEVDYVKRLKQLAHDYKLNDKIEWKGHITGDAKSEVIGKADWFVLPSASENFGISAIEAMAAGVPVILSEEVGIADMVRKHKAGIVYEGDTLGLCKVLQHSINGPPPSMKDSANELARQHYSWRNIASQLVSIYNNLI